MAQIASFYDAEIRDLSESLFLDPNNRDLVHYLVDLRFAAQATIAAADACAVGCEIDQQGLDASIDALCSWRRNRVQWLSKMEDFSVLHG